MKRLCHFLATHFPEYPVPKTELDGAGGTALLKFSSYLESRDVGSYMRSNIGQILSYDCSKIKKDLNFEFRDLDQSIIDTVKVRKIFFSLKILPLFFSVGSHSFRKIA